MSKSNMPRQSHSSLRLNLKRPRTHIIRVKVTEDIMTLWFYKSHFTTTDTVVNLLPYTPITLQFINGAHCYLLLRPFCWFLQLGWKCYDISWSEHLASGTSILQLNYTCYACKHFHQHPDGGSVCNLDGWWTVWHCMLIKCDRWYN